MKKILILIGLVSIPTIADELHVFTNGDVADADKINKNFEILQASGGGCSAEQQDSTVVITCADGTSAVLASEGRVIVYPTVANGVPIDYETLASGQIVVMDNNDVVLGESKNVFQKWYMISIEREDTGQFYDLYLSNNEENSTVEAGPTRLRYDLYYSDEACASDPYVSRSSSVLVDIDGELFASNPSESESGSFLFKATRKSAYQSGFEYRPTSECSAREIIVSTITTLTPLILPDSILEAAYPVRLEQLP